MKRNYFIHNGIKYYSGTTIRVLQHEQYSGRQYEDTATFIEHDVSYNRMIFKIRDLTYNYPYDVFEKIFVDVINGKTEIVYDNHTVMYKKHTFYDELNVDGLFIAWFWYIFIMAISTIFYGRVGWWILTSVVFFNYRNQKLKEAGYK